MKDSTDVYGILTCGFLAVCSIGVGVFALSESKKTKKVMETANNKLGKAFDKIGKMSSIDVDEEVIKKAVKKAADKTLEPAVKEVAKESVKSVENDISRQVREIVKDAYSEVKEDVAKKLEREIRDNISMDAIRRDVTDKVRREVADSVKGDLKSITDEYGKNLRNVANVYGSVEGVLKSLAGK